MCWIYSTVLYGFKLKYFFTCNVLSMPPDVVYRQTKFTALTIALTDTICIMLVYFITLINPVDNQPINEEFILCWNHHYILLIFKAKFQLFSHNWLFGNSFIVCFSLAGHSGHWECNSVESSCSTVTQIIRLNLTDAIEIILFAMYIVGTDVMYFRYDSTVVIDICCITVKLKVLNGRRIIILLTVM